MNKVLTVGAMVAAALGASALLVIGGDRLGAVHPDSQASSARSSIGLPWDIALLPEGASRILGDSGLVLSPDPARASTLADVQRLWPIETQIAIVEAPGEVGALEAFVDPAQLGFVAGKLVVSTRLSTEALQAMKARAAKVEFMESTTRRYTLSADDLAQALKTPISAVSLVPQAQLDAATLTQRFGEPSERLSLGQDDTAVEHLLYPQRGLDIAVRHQGKEVMQYVAPGQFDRLRQPLQAQPRP